MPDNATTTPNLAFKRFLEGYFENIRRELPDSHRARQLEAGGTAAMLVYDFETKFLKEPFDRALREARREQIEKDANIITKDIICKCSCEDGCASCAPAMEAADKIRNQ